MVELITAAQARQLMPCPITEKLAAQISAGIQDVAQNGGTTILIMFQQDEKEAFKSRIRPKLIEAGYRLAAYDDGAKSGTVVTWA